MVRALQRRNVIIYDDICFSSLAYKTWKTQPATHQSQALEKREVPLVPILVPFRFAFFCLSLKTLMLMMLMTLTTLKTLMTLMTMTE